MQIKNNSFLIFSMVAIPLFICFCIAQSFSSGTLYNLPVAVLDEDDSAISRKIIRQIDSTPSVSLKYPVNSLHEGENLIKEGKVYAFVLVPRDFERDILRQKQPSIVLYYNNQLFLTGGIISKDITSAVRFSGKIAPIGVSEHIKSNPYMNYSYFLTLGSFVHVFQIMIAFSAIYSFGGEFKNGKTKELMEISENSILCALFGKLTPYFLTYFTMAAFVYAAYFMAFSPPLNGNLITICLATGLFIFAYQITGVMFVALTTNLRLSLSFGAFYTACGFAFAGLTFPYFAMPPLAQFWASLLPISHYLKILTDQTLRGIPSKYDLPSFLALFALIIFALAFLPLLKKRCYDENRWGAL